MIIYHGLIYVTQENRWGGLTLVTCIQSISFAPDSGKNHRMEKRKKLHIKAMNEMPLEIGILNLGISDLLSLATGEGQGSSMATGGGQGPGKWLADRTRLREFVQSGDRVPPKEAHRADGQNKSRRMHWDMATKAAGWLRPRTCGSNKLANISQQKSLHSLYK